MCSASYLHGWLCPVVLLYRPGCMSTSCSCLTNPVVSCLFFFYPFFLSFFLSSFPHFTPPPSVQNVRYSARDTALLKSDQNTQQVRKNFLSFFSMQAAQKDVQIFEEASLSCKHKLRNRVDYQRSKNNHQNTQKVQQDAFCNRTIQNSIVPYALMTYNVKMFSCSFLY